MLTSTELNREAILESVEELICDYLRPNAKKIDQTGQFPRENMTALAEAGLLGLIIPRELGGLGATPSLYKEIVMRLASACASTALVFVQHMSATSVMLYGAHQPYVQTWLKGIVDGQCLATIAFSEAESGCYFFLPVSQAKSEGEDHFVLNTKKTMVTSAGEADIYVVSTRSTFATNSMQSDFFILTRETEGFSLGGVWEGMGLRGNCSAPMTVKDCLVHRDKLIGTEGEGFKIVQRSLLPMGQIGISSLNLGIAKAIFDESVAYVKKRHYSHLDAGLSSFQSVQQTIGKMKVLYDQAEKSLQTVCRLMEEGSIDLVSTLEIKVMACETVIRMAEYSLNVCGGFAYSSHSPLERLIRDSKAGTIMGPTPEVLKELIGRTLLDVPTKL
ncbi:acyl-CoA/acyl-ACP dehydrogenase [Paenibacillus sp. GSMTC-2017]|uniref:acyl-CoA dehydrogenase family protein n=1 Tax=Paenibacillus sp. GSMTC-2017 TaxID=2794350 RepID=UPI0018D7B208|nr:acyl-CoA dehydrogenase family protein [Paenibacillus sp. GSMTC-2017]MBH5318819.1 acyl-CoA/acyl-ACP dehydrogenase [Paenibacillus sp. GSMTC-2017]